MRPAVAIKDVAVARSEKRWNSRSRWSEQVRSQPRTIFWFQFEEIQRLAEEFGLPPEAARQAVTAMLKGAVTTLLDSDLPAAEVMDLVPVRPMADDEPAERAVLQQRLGAIHRRLTS